MSGFWRNWLAVWCIGVGIFGVAFAGSAFDATSFPVRFYFRLLDGDAGFVLDGQARLTLAVLGAVMAGWSLTLWTAVLAAHMLGERGWPIWVLTTASTILWFAIDTPLSLVSGYWVNGVVNVIFLAGFLIPVIASGVLFRR